MHLFEEMHKQCKNSNILKYYYNLNIFNHFKIVNPNSSSNSCSLAKSYQWPLTFIHGIITGIVCTQFKVLLISLDMRASGSEMCSSLIFQRIMAWDYWSYTGLFSHCCLMPDVDFAISIVQLSLEQTLQALACCMVVGVCPMNSWCGSKPEQML